MDMEQLLSQSFAENHPSDAAAILERLKPQQTAAYLDQLPPRYAAALLQCLVSPYAAECLVHLSAQRFALAIEALPLDTAAALLRRLDQPLQERLLDQAPSDVANLLRRLLRYPETSAGALMDARALALPEDITASEALTRVRRAPRYALYYLYVVDREQKLVGVLNLRELMLASPRASLAAVMRRAVASIPASADRLVIVEHPAWHDVHALPVVDDHGVLLGVLRYETLRELEGKSHTDTAAAGAISAVLTLGELCWVGLAGVLTDLSTTIGAVKTGPETDKEPEHG
jgi:magnesium transporter